MRTLRIGALVLPALALCFLEAGAQSAQSAPPVAADAAVRHVPAWRGNAADTTTARALSSAFRAAADRTLPGVVFIAVEQVAQGVAVDQLENVPEALREFFRVDPRSRPRQGTGSGFIIDEQGVVRYRGAIDNAPIGEVDGGGEVRNHLAAALEELRAGNQITVSETDAYGCTVKYDKG